MTLKPIAVAAAIALISVAGASGAIRSGGGSLHATLTGAVEVPKGDPDGKGTVELIVTSTTVCWEIRTSKIAAPNAAHIHKGAAGVAGPVVVAFGSSYTPRSCVKAPKAVIAAIEKSPGSYYVNVHNTKYPNGALRGQLQGNG
jgi:hypothetical protein